MSSVIIAPVIQNTDHHMAMMSLVAPQAKLTDQQPIEEIDEQQATQDIVSLSNSAEEKERKAFMQDINKFMSEIGKPLSKIPIMGYKELDLFQLFREVVAYGGFNEVVKNVGTWSKIWKRLGNFDPSITDSSFRLKKNYERYLLDYEYKVYPEHKQQAQEGDKQSLRKSAGDPTASPGEKRKSSKTANKQPKRKTISVPTYTKDLVRDKSTGAVRMPLALGDLTIECLGSIIPRSPFLTEKHIWPVGYVSARYFTSMINPDRRVKYTSKIVDGGDKPLFVVIAEDDQENPITSHSPSAAWRVALKRIALKTGNEKIAVSGALRFGLSHPTVLSLIRELPNADSNLDYSLPSSPEGSDSGFPDRKSVV